MCPARRRQELGSYAHARCRPQPAAYRRLRDALPDAIVINEAVELAKAYGTDQSASFVNGVLGKIARSEELPGEDLYQELLAEDRAREEAQAVEAAAKVAVAQAEAGVLAEDADAAEAVVDSVEE